MTTRPPDAATRPPGSTPARPGPAPDGPLRPAVAIPTALVGGLLLWWAFPGAGQWWSAPLGVAALLVVLRGGSLRRGWWLGLLHATAFLLPHLSWAGAEVGWLPLVALVVAQCLFHGVGAVALTLVLRHRPAVAVLGSAAVWLAVEAVRARFPFGGFGWGRLAFSQPDAPTVALASLGGAPLVSFAVVLAGALLARGLHRALGRRPRRALAAAAGAVAVLASGLVVPVPVAAQHGDLQVAGIQGNVPRPGLGFNAERRAVLDNHAGTTRALAEKVRDGTSPAPDLVVWPENASDIDPLRHRDAYEVIDEAVRDIGAPTLVGTLLRDDDGAVRNTTIVWDPEDGPGDQYVKRHPVPFGEYVPYRSFFRRITDKVDLVRADMVAGDEVGVLDVAGTRVGVLICFEVVDDDLVRDAVRAGGRLLVVQTNNATFGYTDESIQQLAMSRVRAVEHGRAVAHVSTVGISAMIRPDGSLVRASELFTRDVMEAALPQRSTLTVAARVGSWPELLLAAGGILCAVTATRRRRTPGAGPDGPPAPTAPAGAGEAT